MRSKPMASLHKTRRQALDQVIAWVRVAAGLACARPTDSENSRLAFWMLRGDIEGWRWFT
ncbi:MAG: hypothetical protein EBY28_02240 [Betaproteobacteria bacterium]|nr:hypothetical protein [Betaproteobacteria bacterium]